MTTVLGDASSVFGSQRLADELEMFRMYSILRNSLHLSKLLNFHLLVIRLSIYTREAVVVDPSIHVWHHSYTVALQLVENEHQGRDTRTSHPIRHFPPESLSVEVRRPKNSHTCYAAGLTTSR